ncbi:multiple epidermal growth factor-like domains protein 10 isoform X2 [Pecten maximus]|uniref:multiple epidermal growth factor-like domains protein 10 isoform X2 n=1 Tax=Pecten maximus TaxID=6579 RepID=UPI00145801E5|nr:multiple epidermal growth factor-like domains protein 10 isoform X2 [Pecten maximus]
MSNRKMVLGREVCLIIFLVFTTIRSEENLALSKAASQSSDIGNGRWPASGAVDGCEETDVFSDCCSHTDIRVSKTAWWRVDLGQISTIDTIRIVYRDNFQQRLAGYQLYVSNTTTLPTDGVLCYEDTSSTNSSVQLVVTHQCPYVGRYVTVYNYRNNPKRYNWYSDDALLELCEVQVFGCPVGMYGNGDCNQVCPASCYGRNCNSKTGSCIYCIQGKYGNTCENDCSTNCKDSLCSNESGFCFECIHGKFGNACDQVCSVSCKEGFCAKDTGYCHGCVDGKFGNSCGQQCSVNCKDRLCAKYTGYCNNECIIGKHGENCDQDCSVNCRDRCTRDNATCIGCIAGRYGVTCSLTCPVTCKDFICNQQTGHCLDCYPGKYGVVCGADCPDKCTDNICSKDNGRCLTTGSRNTEQSSADSNMIIIAVLATVCGLQLAALITTVIYHLRYRQKRKNSSNTGTDIKEEQSVPDTGYTSISPRQEETSHVYEMVVT